MVKGFVVGGHFLHSRGDPLVPVFPIFLFLLNHSDRAVELSGIVGKDLLSGSECTGHVVLAPRLALVVER